MEGGYKITNVQKLADTSVETNLIDLIREATLKKIGEYFENRGIIIIGNLSDYLEKPDIYHGKSIGLKQIIEWFTDVTVSKYYKEIQDGKLDIRYVIDTVKKNLSQGGWDINRHSDIIIQTKGKDDAQKVVNTNINESRILIVKNNAHKKIRPKPKPKSNIPSKKKRKEVKTSKKGGRKPLCQCGEKAKPRTTRSTTHINIFQKPAYHHFCSKECKIAWIYDLLNKKNDPEMVYDEKNKNTNA